MSGDQHGDCADIDHLDFVPAQCGVEGAPCAPVCPSCVQDWTNEAKADES